MKTKSGLKWKLGIIYRGRAGAPGSWDYFLLGSRKIFLFLYFS